MEELMTTETIISFISYLLFMMSMGVYFYHRTDKLEDYLIGGRAMGTWVTALSAQASDMSGWLLMGLPGAVYLGGVASAWIAIGLFIGTFFNWKYVAPRLRSYTEKTDTMTLPTFFEERFKDPSGLLRNFSAIITLFFFTIYSSSGLVASGRLFESMFDIDYTLAVTLGALVIILYTFLGGFLAVCWTDFIQGILMFMAITIVPIFAYNNVGGISEISEAMAAAEISASLFSADVSTFAIISSLAWGLGYFGQPHILARFMSINSVEQVPKAMKIAVVWVFISLFGAVAVGLVSVAMFGGLTGGEQENVFIYMIGDVFNPWIAGVLLAAILSAIMSTIDSQLLVSSSTLTEDFYRKLTDKELSEKKLVFMGRLSVVLISLIALVLALNPENTVLDLVAYAWAGFGAAFGPAVLFALFSENTNWKSVLAGMITGTLVLIVWDFVGLGDLLYNIVPGFIANVVTIFIMNAMLGEQEDEDILSEFNEVSNSSKI